MQLTWCLLFPDAVLIKPAMEETWSSPDGFLAVIVPRAEAERLRLGAVSGAQAADPGSTDSAISTVPPKHKDWMRGGLIPSHNPHSAARGWRYREIDSGGDRWVEVPHASRHARARRGGSAKGAPRAAEGRLETRPTLGD